MSQAQIAGGRLSAAGQYPTRGYRLRDFSLTSIDGKQVCPSDYRGASNLVVMFAGSEKTSPKLVAEMTRHPSELRDEEAQILAIVARTRDAAATLNLGAPFPILIDQDGGVHREFGAADEDGRPVPAIYITDQYGEVFGSFRTAIGQALPDLREILNWLEFVNSQCPECEPPEWPL